MAMAIPAAEVAADAAGATAARGAAGGAAKKKAASKAAPAGEKQTGLVSASEQRARNREGRAQESHKRAGERHEAFRSREAARNAPGPGKAKKAVAWAWSGNRKLLVAEFVICIVILGMGLITSMASGKAAQGKNSSNETVAKAMIKGSALAGLFFLLAILAASGKGAAKTATALGTLVTASYIFTSSDVHAVVSWITAFFSKEGTGAVKDVLAPIPGAKGNQPNGTAQTQSGTPEGYVGPGGTYTSTTGFGY